MQKTQPVRDILTEEEIKSINSIRDPKVQELMNTTPEGKHPFYHAIGVLGGNAVRNKYKK